MLDTRDTDRGLVGNMSDACLTAVNILYGRACSLPVLDSEVGRGSGRLNVAGPFKARSRAAQKESVAVSDG
ncbi:MAG TPA: hypothetical protein VMG30_05755 [Acidobacteriota bacterium]|nr:hypothetical protein [Acidobacteriota bacterium]